MGTFKHKIMLVSVVIVVEAWPPRKPSNGFKNVLNLFHLIVSTSFSYGN